MADYFTSAHFKLLNKWRGQRYDSSNPEQRRAYDELKKAYLVTEAWADELKARCFPTGKVVALKKPTNQASKFLHYNWAKIFPYPEAPENLAYTVGIDSEVGFVVKIDTVKADQVPGLVARYDEIRGPFSNESPIVAIMPTTDGLGKSLDELVSWSAEAIRGFKLRYDDVVSKLQLGKTLSDGDLLKHFDGKPNFKTFRASWSQQDKALFCRLARIVHGAGLDWWHMDIEKGVEVRFGRKNPGSERAIGVLGRIRGTQTRTISWARKIGEISELSREPITEELVSKIETALVAGREALDDWLVLETERSGLWPDQLRHDPNDSGDDTNDDDAPIVSTRRKPFNRIYYGPPGTGKTYALQQELKANYTSPGTGDQHYAFVTFHQSYGYEEFVEGLRPVLDVATDSGQVRYEIRPGAFLDLCRRARLAPDRQFACVIDEINRGNVSKIFGELITLIELDKRDPMDGTPAPVKVTLAYSGEEFCVPANIDIIGTMNTADRSLALVDTALRRRFEFEPRMPDTRDTVDAPLHGLVVTVGDSVIDIRRLLQRMNERIEALYDRDHTIGHAYFTPLTAFGDGTERFSELGRIFRTKIIPLLEEYFFEDWQKIRLVLADNRKVANARFITTDEDQEGDLEALFGADHGLETFSTKNRFALQDGAFAELGAYIGIYEP